MLSANDLKNGVIFVIANRRFDISSDIDDDPYVVLSASHQHIGRGGSSVTVKIKNLRTGQVFEKTFKPSDEFEEAEVERMKTRFLYQSRDVFWFAPLETPSLTGFDEVDNSKNRFSFSRIDLGDNADFLKNNLEISAIKFNEKIIGIELPIKVDYKVIETPPGVRGNTVSGGNKVAVIESGAKISVPLFVEEGDMVRVNTQTETYEKRVDKE